MEPRKYGKVNKGEVGTEVSLTDVWRVGKDKSKIVAKCRSRVEKENIMENKKLGIERIFIHNDNV